jgi:hypothetical protein
LKSIAAYIRLCFMSIKNPNLIPLFEKLKALLEPYAPYFEVEESDGEYGLVHKGEVKTDKGGYALKGKELRELSEVYFAGLIIQKSYVGFYFMPQYTTGLPPENFSEIELLKLLKGKSCYYITGKHFTPEVKGLIKQALDKGFEEYKKRGWVNPG